MSGATERPGRGLSWLLVMASVAQPRVSSSPPVILTFEARRPGSGLPSRS